MISTDSLSANMNILAPNLVIKCTNGWASEISCSHGSKCEEDSGI
jgi:hypothetical protein